jgi:superfamily II DNA/RNA helicase
MAKARLRDPLSIEVSPRNTAAKTVTQWVVPCDKKRKTDLFLFMRKDRGWGQVLVS